MTIRNGPTGTLFVVTLVTVLFFTRTLFLYKQYKVQLESSVDAAGFILKDGYLLQSNAFVYIVSLAMWLPLVGGINKCAFGGV